MRKTIQYFFYLDVDDDYEVEADAGEASIVDKSLGMSGFNICLRLQII